MTLFQNKMWLPWTAGSVWNVLTDTQALASWTPLSVCGDASPRSLVPGVVLQMKKTGWTSSAWPPMTFTVELVLPYRVIHCAFSARAFHGTLDIRLSSDEGDEATAVAIQVTVEPLASRGRFWMGVPLVRTMIQRQVARAFRHLDLLLERRQEQAEQGTNAAYRCWQRIQAERESFRRQLILQSLRGRSSH